MENVCDQLTKYIQSEIDKKSGSIETREVRRLNNFF